jgi:hypothetical protein
MTFRQLIQRLGFRSREPDDFAAANQRRSVDHVDAVTAARSQHGMGPGGGQGGIPPDYVKEYDEGRPRK